VTIVTISIRELTYDYDDVGNVEAIGDGRGGSWSQAFTL
jgi:hypothetical protein